MLLKDFENREFQFLAPYAVKSKLSQGRVYKEEKQDTRTCFERDRDRIIHSRAFRRLKHKTQVFVATEGDHYRTRLTHTLEVAQISRHLARLLSVNEDLSETIALAHDLGHTPFGHKGEDILNSLAKNVGGFEHNQQSLRVVEKLEKKYPNFNGLNLSLEVIAGLKKHETPWDVPSALAEDIEAPSLEAQCVNLADEVAYNSHDLDDGFSAGFFDLKKLQTTTLWEKAQKQATRNYTALSSREIKNLTISQLIGWQIKDINDTTTKNLSKFDISTLENVHKCKEKIVNYSQEMLSMNQEMRVFLMKNFYRHPKVLDMNQKATMIIKTLYSYYLENPQHVLESLKHIVQAYSVEKLVVDYLAGMTDTFAQSQYRTILK